MNEDKFQVEKKGESLILKGLSDAPIKIPSQRYPLTGPYEFAVKGNTSPFPTEERTEIIRRVFDSIRPKTGCCYSNTRQLIDALHAAGITGATPYVGWIIVGGAQPVHHCFTVVDTCILDFLERPSLLYADGTIERAAEGGIDAAREVLTKRVLALQDLPNSQKGTFGQADPYTMYIACPCPPEKGASVFSKLLKTFPNHPSYTNIYKNGSNKTQDILRQTRKEL